MADNQYLRSPKECENYFFDKIGQLLDHYNRKYENFALLGDFNTEVTCGRISNFLEDYNLKNIINSPTCFESDNPKCIDLILTSQSTSFQNTTTIQAVLSDFHSMIVTVLGDGFVRSGHKTVKYRDYSNFNNKHFRTTLKKAIAKQNEQLQQFGTFDSVVKKVLDNHAPIKQKIH